MRTCGICTRMCVYRCVCVCVCVCVCEKCQSLHNKVKHIIAFTHGHKVFDDVQGCDGEGELERVGGLQRHSKLWFLLSSLPSRRKRPFGLKDKHNPLKMRLSGHTPIKP